MSSLHALFQPKAIAVIGASNLPHRPGYVIMKNLLAGGFLGPIMPITPRYQSVSGVLAYPSIEDLPIVPDLAILCVNTKRLLPLIESLGKKGTKVAIVVSAGMNETEKQQLKYYSAQWNIRIIGPNSMGIILPWANLNASFSPVSAHKGGIAFLSQSAAVCTSILDWAYPKNIGFSMFISLGDACDIHMHELLDALMQHNKTQSILLYLDHISDARAFMSSARAMARHRPILVLKSGRTLQGGQLTHQHIHQPTIPDAIYQAAIQRAGLLRVKNTQDLFSAVETLSRSVPLKGERLCIISNGAGPAILAVDALIERGGTLCTLPESIKEKLRNHLPSHTHLTNPLDLSLDATADQYVHIIQTLLDHNICDALLVIHAPSGMSNGKLIAERILTVFAEHPKAQKTTLLTQWGAEHRAFIQQSGYPSYRTPESAVAAFMHLIEYRRNQKQLMETPRILDHHLPSNETKTKYLTTLPKNTRLTIDKTQQLLSLYGFTFPPIAVANTVNAVKTQGKKMGYPLALKVRTASVEHTANLGGVILNIPSETQLVEHANRLFQSSIPNQGLLLQPMYHQHDGQALRLSVLTDATFGPVIYLGDDLNQWDPHEDAIAALPPLNMALAQYTIETALRQKKIQPRTFTPLDTFHLCECLVKLSQCIIDCPEIESLHFHPLLLSPKQHRILSASMTLTSNKGHSQQRLAIRPYPKEEEQICQLKNGMSLLLRPIQPEDEPNHANFIQAISEEDRYRRFFTHVQKFNHETLAEFTQIDFDREMAFVAVEQGKQERILGVVRLLKTPQPFEGEFALLVRSDLKGIGLGYHLLKKIIRYATQTQFKTLQGETLVNNTPMIALAKKQGFQVERNFEDGIAYLYLDLSQSKTQNQLSTAKDR